MFETHQRWKEVLLSECLLALIWVWHGEEKSMKESGDPVTCSREIGIGSDGVHMENAWTGDEEWGSTCSHPSRTY